MAAVMQPMMLDVIAVHIDVAQLELEDLAVALAAWRRGQGERHRQRRNRRFWVRPWIERRRFYGAYETLLAELERESRGDFVGFLRLEPAMFRELLDRVTPRLAKQRTVMREPLQPGLKLAIALRYFASGSNYRNIAFTFRVAHNTISGIVKEVAQAIVDEYREEVFEFPNTPDKWREVARRFGSRWDFHHVCGALDGKHIAIRAPSNSGTVFHNYKGFFSLILLGLADADYKFLWADVGANGSSSDCAVFNASPLRTALETGDIGFPAPHPLPHDDQNTSYFLVGDDAFPLRKWLMKPFSHRNMSREERILNYRLSRARRVVENSFGILAHRFRCILTTMQQEPETVQLIVMAVLCLHNLMRTRYQGLQNMALDREDENHNIVPGAWRDGRVLDDMGHAPGGNVATRDGKQQRVYLKHYYNAVGSVPWQAAMI